MIICCVYHNQASLGYLFQKSGECIVPLQGRGGGRFLKKCVFCLSILIISLLDLPIYKQGNLSAMTSQISVYIKKNYTKKINVICNSHLYFQRVISLMKQCCCAHWTVVLSGSATLTENFLREFCKFLNIEKIS